MKGTFDAEVKKWAPLALNRKIRRSPQGELKQYATWYAQNFANCFRRLEQGVNNDRMGASMWRADLSVASLNGLDVWAAAGNLVRTSSEPNIVRARKDGLDLEIDVGPIEELLATAIVPVFCAGVYFGCVIMRHHKKLRLLQFLEGRAYFDHGQMVLGEFRGSIPYLNPIAIVSAIVLSAAEAKAEKNRGELMAAYRLWAGDAPP